MEEGEYNGYKIEGTALTIKESGVYVVSGSCENGTVTVKKNVTGVTLVLNGLTLSASATAPITCGKGSEVSIVAAAETVSSLSDDIYNNDEIYTDEAAYPDIENAVIKCKDGSNVTICGTGTINITANGKNGIKGGYDLYEEDEEGAATGTLLSEASLTVREVTLNITASVDDGLKSDKELNILSGNITVSAADDAVKCDYVMNIGEEGTEGPVISVVESKEGLEAATMNIYSGNITVNAADDGINTANSDLTDYSYSYNQYGGYVYVNVTNGDGVDSNGTIVLNGGTLEVYSPEQGDGDPLDSERGTYFNGTTVLAAGHLAMAQGYSADTAYVTFGNASGGRIGGFGGMGAGGNNLVSGGSTIQITDESGNVLYSAKAVRGASYILFASPELVSGAEYTLKNESDAVSTAAAVTGSAGGSGFGGWMQGGGKGGFQGTEPGNNDGSSRQPKEGSGYEGGFPGGNTGNRGQFPGQDGGQGHMRGGRKNGGFPGQVFENSDGMPAPSDMNGGGASVMPGDGPDTLQVPEDGGTQEAPDKSGDNTGDDAGVI